MFVVRFHIDAPSYKDKKMSELSIGDVVRLKGGQSPAMTINSIGSFMDGRKYAIVIWFVENSCLQRDKISLDALELEKS